jgi:hypothetical protein
MCWHVVGVADGRDVGAEVTEWVVCRHVVHVDETSELHAVHRAIVREVLVDDLLVAVPWARTASEREAALGWVVRQWASIGYVGLRLGLGLTDDGQWCKAFGVANAIRDQPGDILVVTDADVWCDGVVEAIQRVRDGAPWAIPHIKVRRLNPEATTDVLAGREPHEGMLLAHQVEPSLAGYPHPGAMGGGIVVCRRDVYDACPLDPRFVGWGQEDESWGMALQCLYGPPVRLKHDLWHLWHPPADPQRQGNPAGHALYRRYQKAKRRPEQMRALIDEGRVLC